ncbi:MAG TPA: two-component regulator propeller domain-containing protein [Thermoanaerobaculia bacterium]|nr:two-component regulator propeller domain-containing protein [Thermoanaerobaculia bacterium]
MRFAFCPTTRVGIAVRSLLLTVVSLLAPPLLRGDSGRALTQYIHHSWDSNAGLPQDSVNAIAQTPDGYLWLATQEGIARFDGVGFTIFDSRNTNGIVGNFVYTLHVDRKGTLWVGSGDGLLRYQGDGRFEKFDASRGWPGSAAKSISEDAAGNLWIGMGTDSPSEGKGLIRFREGRWQRLTSRDGLASGQIYATASAGDGSLWIATRNGLDVMRDGTIRNYSVSDGLPDPIVRAVWIARDGAVWAGTPRGLARLVDGKFTTFTTRDGLPDDDIRSIYEDRSGALWIGTLRGLARLFNGRMETAAGIAGLAEDAIFDFNEDREGNLWIGTHSGGLHRFRAGKFTPFGKPEGFRGDSAYAIAEDQSGRMWIGASPGGVTVLSDGVIVNDLLPKGADVNEVRALLHARDGSIWMGSGNGLIRVLNGGLTRFGVADGLPSADVRALYEDPRGTIWLGTAHGLASFERGSIHVIALPPEAPEFVRVIREDRQGRLWIGGGDGLGYLSAGRYTPLPDAGLAEANVQAMLEEVDGTLWFTTWSQGLYRYRSGRVTRFRARDGLYDDVAWSILDDGQGYFWLGSNRGIFRVAKKQLADFAERKRPAIESVVFGTPDGMRKRETNAGGPGAVRTRDGELWFGTTAGVAVVDPKTLRRNTIPPPVTIERFIVNEQPVRLNSPQLAAGSQRIEIHYAALSLVAPERVRYRYRLEGFDDHWIDAGSRRKAYYTNIDPGTYRFRVIAANDDGVWNERGAVMDFRLRAYFYDTPWFFALVIAALIAIGLGLKSFRRRQLTIRHQMYHDPLTGLPNRTLLAERAKVALTQASRHNHSIAVLFIDLDGFKIVNDSHGHAAGDQLLKLVATRFRGCTREIDTLARIGGDEFAVLVSDVGDEERAAEVAKRMIATVQEPFSVNGRQLQLGVSIGIALHPFDGREIESILQAADRAMYRAKLSGGNSYQFNAADSSETVTF